MTNFKRYIRLSISFVMSSTLASCGGGIEASGETGDSAESAEPSPKFSLTLSMMRNDVAGDLDPFTVTATLQEEGVNLAGQTLDLEIPKGSVTSVTDHNDGSYSFTVTPAASGEYHVTISYEDASIERTALVFNNTHPLIGQPMAVPGEYVNSQGYEDGITITPDGEYIFVQYGPIHFSGVWGVGIICAETGYSLYSINDCYEKEDSSLVFDTVGPYGDFQRPDFPSAGIAGGELLHLSGIVAEGLFNGIAGFPTVFYGFKRQADGTFAEPFKISFNDEKGISGPFGMSFVMNGDGTAEFAFAWNNYFDGDADEILDIGEAVGTNSEADIYGGTITLGQDNNLGDIVYTGPEIYGGDFFESITPHFTPLPFSPTDRLGAQGNPHLYAESGTVKSIWTDAEGGSENISVYQLTGGAYPLGTWDFDVLPSDIVTGEEEKMPFFSGSKLYMMRGSRIVYHDYTPTNGACGSTYTDNDCWGDEVIALETTGDFGNDEIVNVGEPTIATYDGKEYLYFVYVLRRENTTTMVDLDMNAGFVEIP